MVKTTREKADELKNELGLDIDDSDDGWGDKLKEIKNNVTQLPLWQESERHFLEVLGYTAHDEDSRKHGGKFWSELAKIFPTAPDGTKLSLAQVILLNEEKKDIIDQTETYLGLGGKKLVNIIDNAHADYIKLPTYLAVGGGVVSISLSDLLHTYNESDKLLDPRANGLDIFSVGMVGLDLDKIEDYAKALNRLGLTDFKPASITAKLGTNKLNDIPTGKTLADLITASCPNPTHHTNYNTLQTQSQEYQRIYAKLSGKVSDTELQTLLDATPTCSHSDYDTLKSERDSLKTENTQLKEHKCDCDSKVVEKEKEIINKIIADLSLSTEREGENVLEAVITEIKTKITPPSDNTQLKDLQTQLKSKEEEIKELKKGNQSQLDLEKLVEQRQAENQALTTAKNELESQLNQEQKEQLAQVLNKSGEVREKVYKEEIIKSIETSLTKQGIDSKKFRQEISALTSLNDIQQLSSKYSNQKLSELKSSERTAYALNIGLGILSLASLIALGYLLIKRFSKEGISGKAVDKKEG